jgi:fatty acid desaturase
MTIESPETNTPPAMTVVKAAAVSAAVAATAAAENAARKGTQTSEFKVTVLAIAVAGIVGGLKALVVIPGPWQIPAALILAVAGASASYSKSRGTVKAAALASVLPMVQSESGPNRVG